MPCDKLRSEKIIHPFYVFQVASIILWSLDDYIYYAFCIALISTLSVVTTLVDTKKVDLAPQSSARSTEYHIDHQTDAQNVTLFMRSCRLRRREV